MSKKINNKNELEFVVFCIENVAKKLGVSAEKIYNVLQSNNIIDGYIAPEYEILHTQDKEYIVNDIIELMQERGIVI